MAYDGPREIIYHDKSVINENVWLGLYFIPGHLGIYSVLSAVCTPSHVVQNERRDFVSSRINLVP